jgi:hypothetical protein
MKLENIVIKAKNKTHAKKIVKWFKSQGANMDFFNGVDYFPSESDDSYCTYYGIINGRFEYWTEDEIYHFKAKIIELPKIISEPELNVIL